MTTTLCRDSENARIVDLMVNAIAEQDAIIGADMGHHKKPATIVAAWTRKGMIEGLRSAVIGDLRDMLEAISWGTDEYDPAGAIAKLNRFEGHPQADLLAEAVYVQRVIWQLTGSDRDRLTLLALNPNDNARRSEHLLLEGLGSHHYVAGAFRDDGEDQGDD